MQYIVRRILQSIPLVIAASILTFVLIHAAPGDPIVAIAGEDGDAGYYEMMRERFGLNRPMHERLFVYLGNLARGDLGFSYRYNQSALTIILEHLPNTLLLMLPALVIAIFLGLLLGSLAALNPHSIADVGISSLSLLGHSIPGFWLGQILLLILAFHFDLFPVQGMVNVRARYEGLQYLVDLIHHMILPVTVLVVQYIASIARVTRTSLLEIYLQPFVTTARAKGLSERVVLSRHALRNAMLPVITIIGGRVGFMFTGAVITETVFAWPGLGRVLLQAMLNRDFAIITAMFLVLSVTVIGANLITDLCYYFLDPRIRFE